MGQTQDILSKLMTPLRKPVSHDEGVLRTKIAIGQSALELTSNETFKSLLKEVDDFYMESWRASAVEDVEMREKCHVAIQILADIQNTLLSRVRSGESARETLEKQIRRQKGQAPASGTS
jgi:hypothetical protein